MVELTQMERDLLIAVNGDPKFVGTGDEDLIFLLPAQLIKETLGDNERTKELIKEKWRLLSEF